MKEFILKALRQTASGKMEGSVVALIMLLMLFIFCFALTLPMVPIGLLRLMGLEVEPSWLSYLGGALFIIFIRVISYRARHDSKS